MRYSIIFLSLVAAAAAGPLGSSSSHDGNSNLAPLYTPPNPWTASPVILPANDDTFGLSSSSSSSSPPSESDDSHLIPDSYIVVLKQSHGHKLPFHLNDIRDFMTTASIHPKFKGHAKRGVFGDVVEEVKHHFNVGQLRGYAGKFSKDTVDWIRRHPSVEFIEKDSIVRAMDLERNAPWGLARLSHRKALTLGTLGRYEYEHKAGEGVDVYVIDTGINIKHVEFGGRAKWGKTMPQNDVDEDGNGHGTHCAGTIASNKYGVAKAANVIAVKVLGSNGSGSMSDVVGGVAWAANAASAKAESAEAMSGSHRGSVASMSLGGGKSPSLDLAVNNAVKGGLHFAVAAGNDNRDACAYSPAAAENAITVGASTIGDARAYFSNFGKCVDIFAPGLNILSTWNTGNTSVNTISGTSMATPHIAGLTAYFLSLYGAEFQPSEVDFAAAGVPFPGSAEEKMAEAAKESGFNGIWAAGRQLVFGGSVNKKDKSSYKPLSPLVLKKTMLRLSTKDALSQMPSDTPNYLAFNNFTAPPVNFVTEIEEDLEQELAHFMPVFDKGQAMIEDALDSLEHTIEEVFREEVAAWHAAGN